MNGVLADPLASRRDGLRWLARWSTRATVFSSCRIARASAGVSSLAVPLMAASSSARQGIASGWSSSRSGLVVASPADESAGRTPVLHIEPRYASLASYGLPSLTSPALEGLRAALAQGQVCSGQGWAVLLFPSPYHGVLARKGSPCHARLRPSGRLRTLSACAEPCSSRFQAIPPVT